MAYILGLDLGTNSIGWALVKREFEKKQGEILGMGSRIIPMSQDIMGDFGKGNSISQTAERTSFRGVRRLRERFLLRRERLHRVLNVLGFLPSHFANEIDFDKRFGKFKKDNEPKLAYDNNQFIFKNSFNEMLEEFKKYQSEFLINKNGESGLVPYDWTIYYLRNKALTQKIEKEELAWILLNFNQKRGYYQLRGEDEEVDKNKLIEFYSLKIIDVIADEKPNAKGEIWYSLILENDWEYRRASKSPLFDWKDKTRDFIVTTNLNDDGSVKIKKDGKEDRSFRAPSETDWTLIKTKTQQQIDQSKKTVGSYIFDALMLNPKQKLNGRLIRTIERNYYKTELQKILEVQQQYHSELQNLDLYHDCIRELYKNNDAHQMALAKKDFVHLFLNDIILYQRPLRSQKSSISNCSLESRKYIDENGVQKTQFIKTTPKSNPYYQEFRLWQWIQNLAIYTKEDDVNCTQEYLKTKEDYEQFFEFLNARKKIDQKALIKYFLEKKGLKGKHLTSEIDTLRWNYVQDKEYPCNETRHLISSRLENVEGIKSDFLTREMELKIWHIIYSVNDKFEYEKAIKKFAVKHQLDFASFVESFRKVPPFKSEYGAFSEKAIKKLLPLMRLGKYWDWEIFDKQTKERILKIINGEFDENIKDRVREKAIKLNSEKDFQGLQLWLAQYIVYDRHSEAAVLGKWNSVEDLNLFLEDFKQHSLRNPIVEQVVTETLRVVKDIWTKYGNGQKDFFEEIHIELGRDMKNTADERGRITKVISENENTNLRLKALLLELQNDPNMQEVRAYSPSQLEILKIYEDGVLNSENDISDDILKISKMAQPEKKDMQKYKLWLDQKYRSPYTGQIIPLNLLFTQNYQIEHIIPQSRYFDDSFGNKVICEAEVNKLKDNNLGLEFIKKHHGTIVDCSIGKKVKVFEIVEYENFVNECYSKNTGKRNKLLLEEIPEKMIERQLNDTRYISKYISNLLSNLVREETNDDGVNSKNIVPCNGKITTKLKNDWGLNDVWNDIILLRFERLNQLKETEVYTTWNENHHKYLPTVPLVESKNFNKKRIDHRHHALDALVIACATKDHINLLNNKSANSETKRYDLKRKLMQFEKVTYNHPQTDVKIEREVPKYFLKPWETFTQEVRKQLENTVVSFKQNLRVINKATNYYETYKDENGNIRVGNDGKPKKEKIPQKGVNWAIRKPLHKETIYGKIDLPRIKVPKGNIITATRKNLDATFDAKRIESITDTGIQKILLNYLETFKGNFDEKGKEIAPEILAFTPEGIEDMNKNIEKYNEGKPHQPIVKVRVFEIGKKFKLGQVGNKQDKYVETAKGTNLFFAISHDENGKRSFETIPLNEVIERQKQGLSAVELKNEKDFFLSPNDLVYVPTADELENQNIDFSKLTKEQVKRIYKFVSCTSGEGHFIPYSNSIEIVKNENGTNGKSERLQNLYDENCIFEENKKPIMIKNVCIKLKTDRLGNISKA